MSRQRRPTRWRCPWTWGWQEQVEAVHVRGAQTSWGTWDPAPSGRVE